MILSDLRAYLKQRQRVTLNDLVIHFRTDAEALRGMLKIWQQKGKVKKMSPDSAICGTSCCKCDPTLTEIYEWVDCSDSSQNINKNNNLTTQ
jgi:putative ferrous iron transport protein C